MDISDNKWRVRWQSGIGYTVENRETGELRSVKSEHVPSAGRMAYMTEREFHLAMSFLFSEGKNNG